MQFLFVFLIKIIKYANRSFGVSLVFFKILKASELLWFLYFVLNLFSMLIWCDNFLRQQINQLYRNLHNLTVHLMFRSCFLFVIIFWNIDVYRCKLYFEQVYNSTKVNFKEVVVLIPCKFVHESTFGSFLIV